MAFLQYAERLSLVTQKFIVEVSIDLDVFFIEKRFCQILSALGLMVGGFCFTTEGAHFLVLRV
jgi:hypothetical protein